MKGKFWRKALAAALALLIVSGGVPVKPFTEIFRPVAITAEAASEFNLTDFLTVTSSGTATGYFTYSDHFYKVEWSGINTSQTTSVSLYPDAYGKLKAKRNGQNAVISLYSSESKTLWQTSNITNLTPGQSSYGYTHYGNLATGANNESNPKVYKKVCTVTCMAANEPTWNWSADSSTCTATFTCAADSSLTATVNATVTESNGGKTASVTFNGTQYSDTKKASCTVTWKNYDGTVLKTDTVNNGSTPSYTGSTPTKAGNAQYSYTFSGWSPAVSDVTSDTTYTAQFSETVNKYNITLPENMEFVPASETSKFDYDSTVSFKAKDGYTASNVKANGSALTADENGVYTVTVEGDVTITADIAIPCEPITYIGENGEEVTVTDYTVLTGNETVNDGGDIELQGGTYVVDGTVTYNSLRLNDNTVLILKDGAKLNITTSSNVGSGDGIDISSTLYVYGQHDGTGELNINANEVGISGFYDNSSLYLYGGNITANMTWGHIGIKVDQVYLGGATLAAKAYHTSTVHVMDGLIYSDGTNLYSGTLTAGQISALGYKTLVRAYAVNLPESTTGGSIKANKSFVAANAADKTITLTVTPNEGYAVKSVKYNDTEITPVNGVYAFTMPAEDVTVSAEFEESKTDPITTQISYVTANGQASEEVTAIVLDENTVIDEDFDWSQPVYYVTGDVVYSDADYMFSNPNGVTLILADDANLNTGSVMTYHRYEDGSAECGAYDVIITKAVGAEGVGKISGQILCKNFVQYAGQLTGIVGAYGDSTGEDADYQGTITLDFADESASANIVTYYEEMRLCDSFIIPDGKALTDGTDIYSGTLTGDAVKNISGKTLVPYAAEESPLTSYMNLTIIDGTAIGINFFFEVNEGEPSDYTVNYGGKNTLISDLPTKTVSGKTLPCLSMTAPAKRMTDKMTVTVMKGETEIKKIEKSIVDYSDILLSDTNASDYYELIKAMLNYGAAAQTYFGYDTEHLANQNCPLDYTDVTIPAKTFEYKQTMLDILAAEDSPVSYYAMNLTLESETELSIHFNIKDSFTMEQAKAYLATFTVDGSPAVVGEKNGRPVITIKNIPAKTLFNTYSISKGEQSFGVSVDMYMTAVMNGSDENLKALCKALYKFSLAKS